MADINKIAEHFSITEPEMAEIMAALIRRGISLGTMTEDEAVSYIGGHVRIYGCRMQAYLDNKHEMAREEFKTVAHDLRSGKCIVLQ